MKKYYITFLFILISISIPLYWVLNKNDHVTNLESAYSYRPDPQTTDHRQWKNIEFKYPAINSDIMSSYWITSGENGIFYIADNEDFVIKKIDHQGNIIQQLGQGNGSGPGEVLRFDGMYADSEQRIWITDELNGRVTIFNQDGSWEIYHPDEVSKRAVPLQRDLYVTDLRFDTILRFKDITNNHVHAYSDSFLVEEGALWAQIFDSNLEVIPDGGFIRSFYWLNDFIRYTENGEIVYFRQPVQPIPFNQYPINPPRRYEPDQEIWFNEMDPASQLQRTADTKILNDQMHFLITEFRDEKRFQNVVDVYHLDTGDYLYSYQLPESLYTFSITANFLAGILMDTQELVIWEANVDEI